MINKEDIKIEQKKSEDGFAIFKKGSLDIPRIVEMEIKEKEYDRYSTIDVEQEFENGIKEIIFEKIYGDIRYDLNEILEELTFGSKKVARNKIENMIDKLTTIKEEHYE